MDSSIDIRDPPTSNLTLTRICLYGFMILSLFSGVVFIILLCIDFQKTTDYVFDFYQYLQALSVKNESVVYSILFLVQLVNNTFMLPFQSFLGIFIVVVFKNSIDSFVFLFCATNVSSYLLFQLMKLDFLSFIAPDSSVSRLIEVIRSETKNFPLKTCLAVNMLFIPPGLKDIVLALVETPTSIYLIGLILNNTLLLLRTYLITIEISDFQGYLNCTQLKSQNSTSQLFFSLSMIIMLLVTVLVSVYFSIKAKRYLSRKAVRLPQNPDSSVDTISIIV